MTFGIAELRAYFEAHEDDTGVLEQLLEELSHRKSKGAQEFLAQISQHLASLTEDQADVYYGNSREDSEAPSCPQCDANMILRTARRGPNAGNQFWGCSDYPRCKGTRDYLDEHSNTLTEKQTHTNIGENSLPTQHKQKRSNTIQASPVSWSEAFRRESWIAEYDSIGSIPLPLIRSNAQITPDLLRTLSQTLFLTTRERSRINSDDDQSAIGAVLLKLLRRGLGALVSIK